MINLVIAFVAGAGLYLGFGFGLGGGALNPWYGIIPGLIGLIGTYFFLVRRTMKQLEAIMGRAQGSLQKIQEKAMRVGGRPSPKEMEDSLNRAIGIMKEGYALGKWQFLVDQQINGQVGSLLFHQKRYDAAEPYLQNSFYKNWVAQAMLAVLLFRKRKYDDMAVAFEKGVKANPKESLMWGVYAWCLWKNKQPNDAIAVLNRAKVSISDERIDANLLALQNNKKMRMDGWREMWFMFGLVKPKQPRMANPFGGKTHKKSIYR
jgi:tetratricopeptide (TPR) repeat protein